MHNPQLMKAKLSQTGIHCSLDWVSACLEWLHSEEPGIDQNLCLKKLSEQWTLTDISTPGVMDRYVLPANLDTTHSTSLPGTYSLQVQHGHDIGAPAYGQLQKLHNVDLENARVSADDSQASQAGQGGYQATQGGQFQQSWEPRPQRMMMLTLTDGQQTVEAMEHQTVKQLPDVIQPGTKIQIMGPVHVRRGIILLTGNNVRMLGGVVEEIQEKFSLQNILQQKIGKDDVGQKGNRFAGNQAPRVMNMNARNQNRVPQNEPSRPAAPSVPPVAAPVVVAQQNDDMDDDDDDLLLLAASQVDESSNANETLGSTWNKNRNTFTNTPVGVVQPIRTTSNNFVKSSATASESKSMKAQTSITSYMSSREPAANSINQVKLSQDDSTVATFALMDDDDDDFFSEVPLEEPKPPEVKPNDPFTYLTHFKKTIKNHPRKIRIVKLKLVSATLATKMHLKKTSDGPKWYVAVVLNDGSDSIIAGMDAKLLDEELGSASDYVKAGKNPEVHAAFKEKMKKFSLKLARLNCIVTLKYEADNEKNFTVIKVEGISGLHLAQMRKRKSSA